MSSDAEDRLFNRASIGAVRVDNATLSRLRECAVYEVCVAGIGHAFLALLASEGFNSMRAALLARVNDVNQPLRALYSNALIASDFDATELHLRPLAGETTIVLVCRFKCYSQRASRDLSDMLLLHYEEHHFGGLPNAQYWRTADIAFAPSPVRVTLFRPLPGSTLPHIRTAFSTTLPPPGLNLSLTPGSQGQFSSSAPSSSSHQASPAPSGHPSRLRRRKRRHRVPRAVTAGGTRAVPWLACCSQCQPAAPWRLHSRRRARQSLASPIRTSCGPIPRLAFIAARAACNSRSRCAPTFRTSCTCCRAVTAK